MTVAHYSASTGEVHRRDLREVPVATRRWFGALAGTSPEEPAPLPGAGGMAIDVWRGGGVGGAVIYDREGDPFVHYAFCRSATAHPAALEHLRSLAEATEPFVPQGDLRQPEPGAWMYAFAVPLRGVGPRHHRVAGAAALYAFAAMFDRER